MSPSLQWLPNTHECGSCPLRVYEIFRGQGRFEAAVVQRFKLGERRMKAGASVYRSPAMKATLFTVLEGWAFRYRLLCGDKRQITDFLLAGDFVGLHPPVKERSGGIVALTDVTLCIFDRDAFEKAFASSPGFAWDVASMAARREHEAEDKLLTLGQRTAMQRVAYLLWTIFDRARGVHLVEGETLLLPLRQHHLADAAGLSLLHTNKTLRQLAVQGIASLEGGRLRVLDEHRLIAVAKIAAGGVNVRPLI